MTSRRDNDSVVTMIPEFTESGMLPPGVFWATWAEIEVRFGFTPERVRLLDGLFRAAAMLRDAGCQTVFLDGSFVTDKRAPNDFDALWDIDGVETSLLDPIILKFDYGRFAQKTKYLGELFPAQYVEAGSRTSFMEFFQTDRETGNRKGIVAFNPASLPETRGGSV